MLNAKFGMWLFLAASGLTLIGCSDAKTNIVEKDPIVQDKDDHDHGHDHQGHGRLLVIDSTGAEAEVYDLEEKDLLQSFELTNAPSALYASGGHRYGVLVDRMGDAVRFIDGGLWQEDHGDHLHDYAEAPLLLNFTITGSRPTHIVAHDGQLAMFFDGDAPTSTPAKVVVINDADIAEENADPAFIQYANNMHGVAEPHGEHVFATVRRSDAESTSASKTLPDQVAVFHLHDDEYEQEQMLDVTCPDLHGAAQNSDYIVFGCRDGLLVVQEQDHQFTAAKLSNSVEVGEGLRIGSVYAHEESGEFIGLASAHGGTVVQWFSIDPAEGEMELIDWQPVENAKVVGRGFSFEAEQFLIMDNQGFLTVLEPHEHDGHTHWEFATKVDVKKAGTTYVETGTNFALTFSQSGHVAYVADPVAQQVVIVDLELLQVADTIELDYSPAMITWLGISEHAEHE